ncbi:FHA domain-containing protein [Rhodopirellula sp. SWK7]|uniref:FHA domain-containing protein n=1 Tax=Rhodopirellula sp. SWK7 TaxID=595460 RepID=UPI0002BE8AA8|nr:FHA domain-containing protein [Rhodopirellula sp. SWK7]EMI44391.1 Forkhead-associated domain protein [Rhodopirellula sp. SWK7]
MSFLDVFDYQLVYRNGDQRGEVIHIEEGKTLLGRSSKCQIHLPTPDISRQHCVLVRTETQLFVYDLDSRNGTKVNRQAIESQRPVELRHRDKLQVGRWKFRFLIKDALSGESIRAENDTAKNTDVAQSQSQSPKNVLNELDAIAEALDISSDEITDNQSAVRDPQTTAPKPTDSKSKTVKPDGPEPKRIPIDPKIKRAPIGLPNNARLQGPSDPRTAADQTLRKLFGR